MEEKDINPEWMIRMTRMSDRDENQRGNEFSLFQSCKLGNVKHAVNSLSYQVVCLFRDLKLSNLYKETGISIFARSDMKASKFSNCERNKYRGGISSLIISLIMISFDDFLPSKTAIFVVRK